MIINFFITKFTFLIAFSREGASTTLNIIKNTSVLG